MGEINMRSHPILHFLAFTCFLVIGYTLSIRFYQASDTMLTGHYEKVTTERQNNIATLDDGQRSILLVDASDIDSASPHLESIWLATYFPAGTSIQMLPIFPSGKNAITSLEQQLDLSFRLSNVDGKQGLDESFLSLLQNNNYWWSGYIVFENETLVKILGMMDGERLNMEATSDLQALQDLPGAMDDPQNSYSAKVGLFQSMCHKMSEIGTHPELEQLLFQVSNHILTDLDSDQLQMELKVLSSEHQYRTCRFPTLEISRIEP
jgi:hypothetical protein